MAEVLHKTVGEIEDLSTSEYLDWIRYFEGKEADHIRQQEISKGNIMVMDDDQIVGALTGGG